MIQNNQLHDVLLWRYAVKKFDRSKKIASTTWKTLEQSLILTPSSFGLQPWQFHIIVNQDLKDQLVPKSWNQSQIADCSHLVVFTTKKTMDENYIQKYIQLISTERNVPIETLDGYKKMMTMDLTKGQRSTMIKEWAARQAYIALGNFMTCAAVLQIDTCPLEGIIPKDYDEILGLTNSDYQTVVACAAGYRSADDKYQHAKKVRFNSEEVIKNHF